ncbi:phosphomannomutase [Tropicimonas isoalkanivorans]|uniref:Phosphomannomutase n=1 Tax=Tropicimonas isoalkanivorans TaxID=441112 RepID=A0A1I1PTV9_9RHOB|nr:phosphomannomutase [Tropicimonas isoalkanivorans]SFD09370.1 phosphomannomutase [Tropicimonas isoalkanivorans]
MRLACFKGYDIRGRVGEELTADTCRAIGRAFSMVMQPRTAVIGRDVRATSKEFAAALAEGLLESGTDVIDIGLCGTEEVYFATAHYGAGGGLMVTASHNPIHYNGIKLVGRGAKPIPPDGGFQEMHDHVAAGSEAPNGPHGVLRHDSPRAAYVDRVLSFIDPTVLQGLHILVNPGNGCAGPTFDAIAAALAERGANITFERLHHQPDGKFPNGIPNPLLPENRPATAEAVKTVGADFGVAWDGDFDRCFLFDETGAFVDGEYLVGLLAQAFLLKVPGAKIVHDPRIMWNTQELVAEAGGEAVASLTGHVHVKSAMRQVDAVYGGEMSAHHYFRDFMYCDSGMIPWLLIAEHICRTGQPLSELIGERREAYPSSGEINFRVTDPDAAMRAVEAALADQSPEVDRMDGLGLAFDDWRLNLRRSATEPVLRLNVETRGDRDLLKRKTDEVTGIIRTFEA